MRHGTINDWIQPNDWLFISLASCKISVRTLVCSSQPKTPRTPPFCIRYTIWTEIWNFSSLVLPCLSWFIYCMLFYDNIVTYYLAKRFYVLSNAWLSTLTVWGAMSQTNKNFILVSGNFNEGSLFVFDLSNVNLFKCSLNQVNKKLNYHNFLSFLLSYNLAWKL